jgi:thiol-disulfide isomerase/thioredoxin
MKQICLIVLFAIVPTATSFSQNPNAQAEVKEAEEARVEIVKAIDSIADIVKAATSSRATVELTTRARIGDQEITNENTVYQIASRAPESYTAYYKATDQSFRVYCNGETVSVLCSPTAYFKAPVPESMRDAVISVPAPLGPYPEPILALTLCGVDPKESLMTDMQSLKLIDRDPYEDQPAVHLQGTQLDGVTWDLWIATEEGKARPLRMLIDLTQVVASGSGDQLAEGFVYELEFLFTLWRMSGDVDESLFVLKPPKDAIEYESLEDYFQSATSGSAADELIGNPAPDGEAQLFAHDEKSNPQTVKLSDLKGKIVVLDFWASWCAPCIDAMPVIDRVTKKFADKDVVFYAVNAGDKESEVRAFFDGRDLKPDVLLDPEGTLSDAFKADAIPQTVIIGKDGRVQMVHVGYATLEAFEKELSDQLEVVASGGSLTPESPK